MAHYSLYSSQRNTAALSCRINGDLGSKEHARSRVGHFHYGLDSSLCFASSFSNASSRSCSPRSWRSSNEFNSSGHVDGYDFRTAQIHLQLCYNIQQWSRCYLGSTVGWHIHRARFLEMGILHLGPILHYTLRYNSFCCTASWRSPRVKEKINECRLDRLFTVLCKHGCTTPRTYIGL